jgi:hypothetical protein
MTDSFKYIRDDRQTASNGCISLHNSSSEPLNPSELFNGSIDDIYMYSTISISAYSDQTGSILAEQSVDGVNFDHKKTFTVSPNISEVHSIVISSRYFRLTYTNGLNTQSFFRLSTMYHISKSVDTNVISSDSVHHSDNDVTVSKNITDYDFDMVTLLHANKKVVTVSGFSENIHTLNYDVCRDESDGLLMVSQPLTAQVLNFLPCNANDVNLTGSGVWKIKLSGLDSEYLEIEETVEMTGLTPSNVTINEFLRVNKIEIVEHGTKYGTAENKLTCVNVDGDVMAQINPMNSMSHRCFYTIPKGCRGYLKSTMSSCSSDKMVKLRLNSARNNNTVAPFEPVLDVKKWSQNGTTNSYNDEKYDVEFEEKTDIYITGLSNAGICELSCGFKLLQILL